MQQFCAQLDFLSAEGYVTPTMRELVARPTEQWTGRTVVLTFDDGYFNNLPAWEELHKRGMRATWFIVSGSIGNVPRWPLDGRPDGRLLNPNELRQMHESGMEIGSHTASHVRLPHTLDGQLEDELAGSKATLEDMLGADVASFAYPYGELDDRCARAVQAHYRAACTTRTGWALRDRDPYRLRRLTVFNVDTISTFARKLQFADNDVSWLALARYSVNRIRSRFGRSIQT